MIEAFLALANSERDRIAAILETAGALHQLGEPSVRSGRPDASIGARLTRSYSAIT